MEMFEEPRLGIKRMEMRFRPYVEQATYYQFLAGTSDLFDTETEKLTVQEHTLIQLLKRSIVVGLPFLHSPTCQSFKTFHLGKVHYLQW